MEPQGPEAHGHPCVAVVGPSRALGAARRGHCRRCRHPLGGPGLGGPSRPGHFGIRRHQTCDFREHATPPPAELGGKKSSCLPKSSPYAGPCAGTEVAGLRKCYVWCASPTIACPSESGRGSTRAPALMLCAARLETSRFYLDLVLGSSRVIHRCASCDSKSG